MVVNGTLKGKNIVITGASRGIGKAIAIAAAKQGANIAILAKTATPHPKLKGTIYTAAKEIEAAGGKALPIVCDIRSEEMVQKAIDKTVEVFGGIDILVNNASAINIAPTETVTMKKYDLMNAVNGRGTFLCSKLAIPHLKKATNPHILNLSPPLSMDPKWFRYNTAYTMAKYGMSMCCLGMSAELARYGIAVNCLWPRTAIATAAVNNELGGEAMMAMSLNTLIMSDAAMEVLTSDSRTVTGNFFIDDDVVGSKGFSWPLVLAKYAVTPGSKRIMPDYFVDDDGKHPLYAKL